MKSINFEFLRTKWPELAGLGGFAEAYAHADPVGSISKMRVFCEQVVEWIHHDQRLAKPFRASLNDLLHNQADGRTLDDKRDKIGADDDWQDLDVLRKAWPKWNGGKGKKHFKDRTANAFFVPKKEIEENAFDLSINRYKEIVHEEVEYDPPKVIIGRLKKLEKEIAKDLKALEAMLG